MCRNEHKPRIRAFLARAAGDRVIRDDDDIFAKGFVNSLFAMELVLFVEKEFGITVANEDLDIAHFRSVNAIAALVDRKTQG